MKVLILAERFPFTSECDFRGGVEARTYSAALALAAEHEVTIIAADEAKRSQAPIPGLRIIRCGPKRTWARDEHLIHRVVFLCSIEKEANKLDFDVIEATDVFTAGAAMRIAKKKSVRAVCTYHDLWLKEWQRNIGRLHGLIGEISERKVLKFPWSKIIAVSTVTRAKLIEHGVPPDRIAVVPNGVSITALPKPVKRFDRPTVIFVGRLVTYKRIEDCIKSVAELRTTIPNIQLKIVGSGPDRATLQTLVERLELQDVVVFHGFIPKLIDVLSLVAQSHVLALPSTVEGFGLVTIESMAVGTPYVASEIPPTVEVTHNGIGGILYPPGNVNDLTAGLKAILTDRAYGEQLGKAGQEFVLGQYDWDVIGEQLRDVYRNLK